VQYDFAIYDFETIFDTIATTDEIETIYEIETLFDFDDGLGYFRFLQQWYEKRQRVHLSLTGAIVKTTGLCKIDSTTYKIREHDGEREHGIQSVERDKKAKVRLQLWALDYLRAFLISS